MSTSQNPFPGTPPHTSLSTQPRSQFRNPSPMTLVFFWSLVRFFFPTPSPNSALGHVRDGDKKAKGCPLWKTKLKTFQRHSSGSPARLFLVPPHFIRNACKSHSVGKEEEASGIPEPSLAGERYTLTSSQGPSHLFSSVQTLVQNAGYRTSCSLGLLTEYSRGLLYLPHQRPTHAT